VRPLRTLVTLRKFVRSDFVRHGALVFISSMIVNVLNFVFHVLNVRLLSISDYGSLASLFAASTVISIPSAAVNLVVVRYAAEFHALGDRDHLAALTARAMVMTASVSAAIVAGAWIFREPLAGFLHIDQSALIVVTSVIGAINFALPSVRGILQGIHDFARYSISTIVEVGGKLVLGVGLVFLGFHLAGAVGGYALASVIGFAYTFFAIGGWPANGLRIPFHIDLRRLYETSSGVTLATLALGLMGSIDVVLVKHFFSPQDAGVYAAIALVGKPLMFIVGFVPTVLFPIAAAKVARNESPLGTLKQAFAITALLCGVGLVALRLEPVLAVRVMAGSMYVVRASPHVFAYAGVMTMYGLIQVVVNYKLGLNRYDFLIPLVAASLFEIIAIAAYHPSIDAVIRILAIGHGAALLMSLYRVTAFEEKVAQPDAA
jgi:O-antigen/teichoic acid export membrane protein